MVVHEEMIFVFLNHVASGKLLNKSFMIEFNFSKSSAVNRIQIVSKTSNQLFWIKPMHLAR